MKNKAVRLLLLVLFVFIISYFIFREDTKITTLHGAYLSEDSLESISFTRDKKIFITINSILLLASE
jgi:hypothetical protein